MNKFLNFSNLFITGIQEGLITLSEELAAGKLVKNLTLFPALQITLVHPDMTREFEHACQVELVSKELNHTDRWRINLCLCATCQFPRCPISEKRCDPPKVI